MSRNSEVLSDFTRFCRENPDFRFWQALTNWSGASRIELVTWEWSGKCSENDPSEIRTDPYYFEGRNS